MRSITPIRFLTQRSNERSLIERVRTISVFMATRPPNFAQMDEKAQEANAWAQWINYYSKRPNAPDLKTVPECTAYVLTQWVKEQS